MLGEDYARIQNDTQHSLLSMRLVAGGIVAAIVAARRVPRMRELPARVHDVQEF